MEGAAGHGGFLQDGRLHAAVRAALFILLFLGLLMLGILMVPGIAQTGLPEGDGLPLGIIAQFAIAMAAALGATWVLRTGVERKPADGLDFPLDRRAPRELGGGILLGLIAMAAVVGLLALAGVYRFVDDGGGTVAWLAVAAISLAAFAIPAAAEEAIFRGYLLDSLGEAAGVIPAVLITSLLFAVVHGGNPSIGGLAFINIFLAGILLAVAVLRTGTLWLATGVHLGWNWAMAGPLDLPVSGLDPYDAPFYDAVPSAAAWLSGGVFGPEGGLAGTAAALVALALVIWTTRPGAPLAPAVSDRRI